MDYQKALRILGLKTNFTAEELKKAHRELANLYHPDRNKSPEAESKMKDINEARDYLVKYLKDVNPRYNSNRSSNDSNNNQKDFDIERYKTEKETELFKIIKLDFDKYNVSENIKVIILTDLKIYIIFHSFDNLNNKYDIDKQFNKNYEEIKKGFKKIKEEFYKENNISESDVKENINYDCTLTEFYENLLKIKEKYGKEAIITDLLEKEIEKYKTYAGYDEIADRIEDCTNNTFYKIKNNNFNYTKNDINDMHIEIEQIFKTYYILIKKIKELENIVNTIENQEIKNYYKLIERNFYSGIPYSEFDEHIKELEDLINKYNKEKQKKIEFKKNEQQINQIYQSLINRCSDEIKKHDIITTEQSQIDIQLNLLKELVELFIKGCQEFKDLEYFNLFNEITFIDTINDNKIKETIIKKYNSNNISNLNKNQVYVKRKDKIKGLFDGSSFFYLEKDKMQIYKLSDSTVFDKRNITQQELDENYISLNELLNISEYVGKWITDSISYEKRYVCYQADGYIIYRNSIDERIRILVNPRKHYNGVQKDIHFIIDEFKDKNSMQDLIEKQIKQRIDEYNQEKSRNDRRYSFDPNSKEYKNIYGESVFQNYSDFDSYKADKNFHKKRK